MGHLCPPGFGSGFGIRIWIYWPDWIWIQFGSGSETLVTFVPSCEDWKWCSRNEVNNTSDCILNKSGAFLRISPHTVKGFPVLLAPHSKKKTYDINKYNWLLRIRYPQSKDSNKSNRLCLLFMWKCVNSEILQVLQWKNYNIVSTFKSGKETVKNHFEKIVYLRGCLCLNGFVILMYFSRRWILSILRTWTTSPGTIIPVDLLTL